MVIVEWQATRAAEGRHLDSRGVDKFRLRDGRAVGFSGAAAAIRPGRPSQSCEPVAVGTSSCDHSFAAGGGGAWSWRRATDVHCFCRAAPANKEKHESQ